jgi:prepilin-type processing-associated H-X9-DG protein
MYLGLNKGRPFNYEAVDPGGGPLEDWMMVLLSYHSFVDDVRLCPEAVERAEDTIFGDVHHSWGSISTFDLTEGKAGSYGMNLWLCAADSEGRGGGRNSHGLDAGPGENFLRLPAKGDTEIPLFADSIWYGGYPKHTDDMPSNLRGIPSGAKGMMDRFFIDRHMKAINICFLDGHVERVELTRLWMLKWNNQFVPETAPKILPPY